MKENTIRFNQNDKVACYLTSGFTTTGIFSVKTVLEKAIGILSVDKKEPRMQELASIVKNKKTIMLFVDRINDEQKFVFSLTPIEKSVQLQDAVPLNFSFTSSNTQYNQKVFDALVGTLDFIDSDEKFEMVKHLFDINRKCKMMTNMSKDFFFRCLPKYQNQLWAEGYFPYISNAGARSLWKSAEEEARTIMLKRLGIEWPKPEPEIITNEVVKEIEVVKEVPMSNVTLFFDNIAEEVLRNIKSASESIHVAMAWFTNFDIFKALKDALARGVKVILVTNNDLINNGGYCLNFNELIDAGTELHIAEYPAKMMHHKFCIVDGALVMNGSYNWTFLAEEYNLENMIVIKDAPEVIEHFESAFSNLLEQFPAVDHIPDTVPEKPEYDRGSFKQYISEELVARSKRGIGDVRENVRKAKALSPQYLRVTDAVVEYNLEDNASRTISEIDTEVISAGLHEREQRQEQLELQQRVIEHRVEQLNTQQQTIMQRQQTVEETAAQRIVSASTETERAQIREETLAQQQQLSHQLQEIHQEQSSVHEHRETVRQELAQTRSEINIIQQTSTIQTTGGRGSLKINLKWATIDDLDLHVYDPDGTEIYYREKRHVCQGVLGQLDVDANANNPLTTSPQENIYWEGKAPIGDYLVKVVLFAKRSSANDTIPFTVTVYPQNGESKIFTNSLSTNKSEVEIVKFTINGNGIEYN